MRKTIWCALIAATWTTSVFAANARGTSGNYVSTQLSYEINDSQRDADNGFGGQLSFGIPLTEHGALELSYLDIRRDRALDGDSDFQTSMLLQYVYDFGDLGPFKPFLVAGVAGVQEDILGTKTTHIGLDTGVGALFTLPWKGLAVRTEARALAQENHSQSAPADEDLLVDYRVMVGLQAPLSFGAPAEAAVEAPAAEEPAPAAGCDLSVVDPASGRTDCAADSDRDGVADGADQCPATESGVPVNAVGCPATEEAPTPAPEAPPAEPAAAPEAPAAAPLAIRTVNFNTGSFDIDTASKERLDNVIAVLAADPTARLEISGHADNRGSEAANIVLGAKRAEAVRQYLLNKGVDAGRLTTISVGPFDPVADNSSEEGRRANRSVQFRVIK